ncbi:Nba1p NDAI_0G02810 [Naumovozyma dairenensis CBS 421]|uniref:Protein NBA1 n=1 Tax=Naumovozyma dairenensis (strain ATCC 10597 / BCRC 20456 / CBS 421 / NBRC 0211 / NRRL Y-12639) TaxID=1071378 RepID=G0WE47_NAUDC|nr:hypothetical protein NDAI_0G02810 [Naumovozyma dairenensis CBS 421]CCD26058.2 hypothetical protein NDAI_0G02810 [Naumovozyma dairenensis CBS 421]
MSLEAYESPSKVSVNTQRLSDMIDSLHNEQSEADLFKFIKTVIPIARTTSPADTHTPPPTASSQLEAQKEPTLISPSKPPSGGLLRSPAGNVSIASMDNRSSMISNYSGVLQEGVEISYVVQNQSPTKVRRHEPRIPELPTLPSEEDMSSVIQQEQQPPINRSTTDITISAVSNAKPVRRFDSKSSMKTISREPSVKRNDTLKLLGSPKRGFPSIDSGNLASESGTSSYYPTTAKQQGSPTVQQKEHVIIIDDDEEQEEEENDNEDSRTASTNDHVSMVSSIIPPLSTTITTNDEGMLPLRSEINEYNPAVPPRSKDRPRSRLFVRDEMDDSEEEDILDEENLAKERQSISNPPNLLHTTNNIHEEDSIIGTTTPSRYSESFYSAASFPDTDKVNEYKVDDSNNDQEDDVIHYDETYLSRPLPNVPQPQRDETIKVNYTPHTPGPQNVNTNVNTAVEDAATADDDDDDDDQYEDIDETVKQGIRQEQRIPKVIPRTKPPKKNKNKKKKQHKNDLSGFDIDTLNQLLNVTKGTLIGSEFNNLGMKIEEKRALERLVDSLSRLTADMVLDPDRFEEGLKRLEKATKALDGF